MLSPETRIARATTALTAEIDAELVMMDGRSGCYFNLDRVAAEIWQRIAEPVAIEQLCAALSERYDGDISVIRRDVLALFTEMAEKGLVLTAD